MLKFATLLGVEEEKARVAVDEVYDLEYKLAEVGIKLSFTRTFLYVEFH